MHKLASRLTVCLAALVAAGAASAEDAPKGVWLGHTGNAAVELTKCGGSLCGRVVKMKDGAEKSPCKAAPGSASKSASKDKWDGGWLNDSGKADSANPDSKTIGLDKLKFLADVAAKLFTEPIVWKGSEEKKCDEASKPPAPPAPTANKAPPSVPVASAAPAKAPVARAPHKAPAARIAAPVRPTIQGPVREATKIAAGPSGGSGGNCKKYFSQIGETVTVPCD